MTINPTSARLHTLGVRRGMRDGVEVHKAALEAGCHTVLYPRQVLRVTTAEGDSRAFTHGIPQSSTLSGVTFTQDLRMRRGLLGKAGVLQPRGATFSIGRGRKDAQRYANRLGYPVVVKPEWGDSTIDVVQGVKNNNDLNRALDTLLVPPHERPHSTEAAYGLTELRKPGFKNGRETVPPGYRVLVEEEIPGDQFRLLTLGGQIIDALHIPDGPWGERVPKEAKFSDTMKAELRDLVKRVGDAVTGLAILTIDVVIPAESSNGDRTHVVDVSERPWLDVQYRVDPARAASLAQTILTFEIPSAKKTPPTSQSTQVDVEFHGVVSPDEFAEVLKPFASSQGIDASVESTDAVRGRLSTHLVGSTGSIAEMVEVFLDSGVNGQTAMKATLAR